MAAHQGVVHYLRLRAVASATRRNVPQVAAGATVTAALAEMRRARSSGLLVRYDRDHGLLTERDAVRLIALGAFNTAVGGYASRPLVSVPSDTTLLRARRVLSSHGIRHLVVTDTHGVIARIAAVLCAPFSLNPEPVAITASLYPRDGETLEALLAPTTPYTPSRKAAGTVGRFTRTPRSPETPIDIASRGGATAGDAPWGLRPGGCEVTRSAAGCASAPGAARTPRE